jgi:8-oxo-dGTP pyrophosphatase MutT (NUDIX family)
VSESQTVRDAVSAGGVVYRHRDGRVEVVLVAHPSTDGWVLPKGRPEPGETIEQTALREVTEETGLEVEIVAEVGADHYSFAVPEERVRINKVVHHYLMEPRGGDFSLHDGEHEDVGWFDINEAFRVLTFDSQRDIMEQASMLIRQRSGT